MSWGEWAGAGVAALGLAVSIANYVVVHAVREAVLGLRVQMGQDLAVAKTEAQKWVEDRFVAKG